MSNGYFRLSIPYLLAAGSQAVAPPLVSTLTLIFAAFVMDVPFGDEYVALAAIASLLIFMLMRAQSTRVNGGSIVVSGWTIVNRVLLAWAATIGLILLLGYAAKISPVYSRRTLFLWFLITPPVLAAMLVLLRQWFRNVMVSSGNIRSAVIAGVNPVSRELARNMEDHPEFGLLLKGFFDDRSEERLGVQDEIGLLGRLNELPDYIQNEHIDTLFIAIPLSYVTRIKELLERIRDTTVSIYFVPDIFAFELIQSRSDNLNGIPVVALCETPFYGWRGLIKRSSDLVFASIMLLMALPVMAAIAIGIKLSMPGTVLFRQRRYGLGGEEIVVYKFRTMKVSEDGDRVRQATRDDDRITPFGHILRKTSLDELPQLINVLQGRMSLVGPRPHAVAHNEEYRKLIEGYMVRHKVPPGITGLAQVNGCRGETACIDEMKQRINYDLEYLRRWSLLLDLRIIFKTLAVWFRDEKAY